MLSDTIFANCLGQISYPEVSCLAYHFAAWCASLGPLRPPLFWSRRESLTHWLGGHSNYILRMWYYMHNNYTSRYEWHCSLDYNALFDDFLLSTLESIEALATKSLSIEGTFPLKTTKSPFSCNFSSLIPSDFHTIPFINYWHCCCCYFLITVADAAAAPIQEGTPCRWWTFLCCYWRLMLCTFLISPNCTYALIYSMMITTALSLYHILFLLRSSQSPSSHHQGHNNIPLLSALMHSPLQTFNNSWIRTIMYYYLFARTFTHIRRMNDSNNPPFLPSPSGQLLCPLVTHPWRLLSNSFKLACDNA